MKKLLLALILLTSSCLTHKDLAQVESNAYENARALHQQQKVEYYIQQQVNRWFLIYYNQYDKPYVELIDVQINAVEREDDVNTYQCSVAMITEAHPYVVANMTISVMDGFRGFGQFTMDMNPWSGEILKFNSGE